MTMEGKFRLYIERKNKEQICYEPPKDKKSIVIGSAINADIKCLVEDVSPYHCELILEQPENQVISFV